MGGNKGLFIVEQRQQLRDDLIPHPGNGPGLFTGQLRGEACACTLPLDIRIREPFHR